MSRSVGLALSFGFEREDIDIARRLFDHSKVRAASEPDRFTEPNSCFSVFTAHYILQFHDSPHARVCTLG